MKGICFKEPLFHATLEGQKTQTRRIVKTERLFADGTRAHEYDDGSWGFFNAEDYLLERNKPRYKVGEKVYLKEPYKIEMVNGRYMVFFSYSGVAIELPKEVSSEGVLKAQKNMRKSRTGYCNKMFTVVGLPEHFPHFIEITAVRCERLQNISDEDCLKEGIKSSPCDSRYYINGIAEKYRAEITTDNGTYKRCSYMRRTSKHHTRPE